MEFVRELGLYDLVGYFIPGSVLLFTFAWTWFPTAVRNVRPSYIFVFIVGSYITGHLLQGIGGHLDNSWENYERHAFMSERTSEYKKKLAGLVSLQFELSDFESEEVYSLCKNYCQAKGVDRLIEIMEARYAFYRGLFVAFCICLMNIVVESCWRACQKTNDNMPAKQRQDQPQVTYVMANSRGNIVEFKELKPSSDSRPRLGGAKLVWLLIFLVFAAGITWSRFRDFDKYRVSYVYGTFLAHSAKAGPAPDTNQSDDDEDAKP